MTVPRISRNGHGVADAIRRQRWVSEWSIPNVLFFPVQTRTKFWLEQVQNHFQVCFGGPKMQKNPKRNRSETFSVYKSFSMVVQLIYRHHHQQSYFYYHYGAIPPVPQYLGFVASPVCKWSKLECWTSSGIVLHLGRYHGFLFCTFCNQSFKFNVRLVSLMGAINNKLPVGNCCC